MINADLRIDVTGVTPVNSSIFDLIKLGIFESDRTIRIVAANRAACDIAGQRDGISFAGDRLLVESHANQQQLRDTINRVMDPRREKGVAIEACNIDRPSGKPPYRSLIVGGASGGETAFIIISDDEADFAPDSHWLESWFDLTPCEARLASLLAAGLTLEQITKRMDIGITTARTHLSRTLDKTQTSRQAELVAKILRGTSFLRTAVA